MANSFRKGLKLIGPYPYNPYLIFLFFSSIFLSRFAPFISLAPGGSERWRAAALVILASSLPGVLFAGGAILLKRFRFWSEESTFLYILEVAFFLFLNLLTLRQIMDFLSDQIGDFGRDLLPLTFNVFIITLALGLITLALMHQAERRISERLNTATELVLKLEAEREGLIHSDENLRRQTSQFLHDRVQSDLMVVGMKLKSISGQSSAEVNEVIDRAIIGLENTRTSDLKNLIQVLTPNLEAGSLQAALDVLLEQYRNSMEVSVKIDATTKALDSKVLLGIFRIVEQSILNSLVHGPAKRVQISVSTDSAGVTDIIISDDGPGISVQKISSGLGTSIIDSWVGILNGSKEIDSAPGHGYQLHVTFIAH
jgi:signal transduction histidine kinase